MTRFAPLALGALLAVAPAAAQDHSSRGTAAPGPTANPAPLDERTKAAVLEGLADERRTEAVYEAVIAKHGGVRPFVNTVRAEARHAAFLEALLTNRGLDVPKPAATAATAPASVREACTAALQSERENVALYDRLLAAGPLPEDVKSAFEHNRRASLEHHVSAFERCVARGGGGRSGGGHRGCGPCGHCNHGGGCGGARGTLSAPAGAGAR